MRSTPVLAVILNDFDIRIGLFATCQDVSRASVAPDGLLVVRDVDEFAGAARVDRDVWFSFCHAGHSVNEVSSSKIAQSIQD